MAEVIEMEDIPKDEEKSETYIPSTSETSFSDLPNVPMTTDESTIELRKEAFVADIRTKFELTTNVKTRVYSKLTIDEEGSFRYNNIKVSRKGGKELLAVNTLSRNKDSREFLEMLGFPADAESMRAYNTKQNTMTSKTVLAHIREQKRLDPRGGTQSRDLEAMSPEQSRDLGTVAPEQSQAIKAKIESFKTTENWARTEKEKTMRQLENTLDENTKNKLRETVEYYNQMEIQAKRRYSEIVQNQLQRVNEIINDKSRTLGERLKELFRRDGLTIGAIITALGMTISTIILSFTGGSPAPGPTPSPTPPPTNPIKKVFIKLANFLLDLAKKALTALPGALGSLVSFLFKKAAETVLFLSQHLILFFIGLILLAAEFIFYGKILPKS
jgi:hypothetical protein